MTTSETTDISLQEALKSLNYKKGVRSLRTHIEDREKFLGVRIMTRISGQHRTGYRVTLSALRMYCPRLFDGESDVVSKARAELDDMAAEVTASVLSQVRAWFEEFTEDFERKFAAARGVKAF